MNTRVKGNKGEDLACEFLKKSGYSILERNKHYSRFCELDIIAKEKDTVVFVEVKARKSDAFGVPQEAITKTKYENIKKGVGFYLTENNIKKFRIDVIAITYEPTLKIEHLKNVFL